MLFRHILILLMLVTSSFAAKKPKTADLVNEERGLIDGFFYHAIDDGKKIGEKYLTQSNLISMNDSEKVNAIIKEVCLKNALYGGAFGLIGWFGIPVGLYKSLKLQVQALSFFFALLFQ